MRTVAERLNFLENGGVLNRTQAKMFADVLDRLINGGGKEKDHNVFVHDLIDEEMIQQCREMREQRERNK